MPKIRLVAEELEAEIRYCLLPISRRLKHYEQLVVESRIKECESAIDVCAGAKKERSSIAINRRTIL